MRLGPAEEEEEEEEEEVEKLKQSSSQLPHTVIVRTSDCSRPTATGSCQRSLGGRRKVDWTVTMWGVLPSPCQLLHMCSAGRRVVLLQNTAQPCVQHPPLGRLRSG